MRKPYGDPQTRAALDMIRQRAAARCGLSRYPVALIRAWEAADVHWVAWGRLTPDVQRYRLDRLRRERAALR